MNSQTKVSPKLAWMKPYLEAALPHLPEGKHISRLSAWSIDNKRVGKRMLACIMTDDWVSYRIYLHTHRHPRDSKVLPNSKIDLLSNLAHELAHTLDMLHSPEHKALESRLSELFMNMLRDSGYTNEEDELSGVEMGGQVSCSI